MVKVQEIHHCLETQKYIIWEEKMVPSEEISALVCLVPFKRDNVLTGDKQRGLTDKVGNILSLKCTYSFHHSNSHRNGLH